MTRANDEAAQGPAQHDEMSDAAMNLAELDDDAVCAAHEDEILKATEIIEATLSSSVKHTPSPPADGSDLPNQVFVDPKVGSVWYTDLTLSAKVPTFGGTSEFFLTVNNLFDRRFPIIPGTNPGLNLPTIISVYDQVRRAFTAGVRARF